MVKSVVTRVVCPVILTALLSAAAWLVADAPTSSVQASTSPRPLRQSQVVGEGQNRAAVAMRFGDGRVESRCVAFDEPDIRGDVLLERSGLGPAISPEGGVCSIGGEGCPTDDCFCQCQNFQSCRYWAYYQWKGAGWNYSQFGAQASNSVVRDGDLQAWAWGSGNATSGAAPPDVSFDDVCNGLAYAGPTPTALLLARGEGGSGEAPAVKAGSKSQTEAGDRGQLAESRRFSPQLLPGYAAYFATVTVLLAMGWHALRRRSGRLPAIMSQLAQHEEPAPHSVQKE